MWAVTLRVLELENFYIFILVETVLGDKAELTLHTKLFQDYNAQVRPEKLNKNAMTVEFLAHV